MSSRHFTRKLLLLFLSCSLLHSLKSNTLKITPISPEQLRELRPSRTHFTFIVYMAADNDLYYFAERNLKEMAFIGSNQNLSIVVQLDGHGAHEHTKRLYVTKEGIYQLNAQDVSSQQKLNSGSALTLIDCCKWAIKEFPADHYALILWNHGTGILDSIRSKTTNASELFTFNPATHMLELDRSIDFLDYMERRAQQRDPRGVCFSDTYGSYLTNQKLDYALKTICEKFLNGKKFDIIAFDACLMAMVEVANLIQPYADYMVASQEVELGTGWPYHLILAPFRTDPLSPELFAQHIIAGYSRGYENITQDFTQSAIKLKDFGKLDQNIKEVVSLLLEMLYYQLDYSVKRAIRASRSKRACTSFSEPSYIDLHHFYTNLLQTIDFMKLEKKREHLVAQLVEKLGAGLKLIESLTVANAVGANLQEARGLSIYFPLHRIDTSYLQTPFAKKTKWSDFLNFLL